MGNCFFTPIRLPTDNWFLEAHFAGRLTPGLRTWHHRVDRRHHGETSLLETCFPRGKSIPDVNEIHLNTLEVSKTL